MERLRDQLTMQQRKSISIPVPDGMCYEEARKVLEYVFCQTDVTITLHIPNIPVPDGMCYEEARKVLEYVFCQTDVTITLHIPKATASADRKTLSTDTLPRIKEKKRTDTGVVVVKAKSKEYAELLKAVKKEVGQGNVGTEVKSVRRSKKGDLLLIVDGGRDEATKMGNLIKTAISDAQVVTKGGKKEKILHVSNMDGVTTKEEIAQVIKQVVGEAGKATVKSLRPA
ncbi:hypothetical protein QE152_g13941 [Popillia japonica]|uniref:Uncharacterized protein n=1 Tax=Popillia japonica TaxID=7064 RepID=A0AAW1LBA3_POPJA